MAQTTETRPETPPPPPGRIEDYRLSCLKLEKTRHERVYEAERKLIYSENAVLSTYHLTILQILGDFDAQKRALLTKALTDNAEKTRQVEELRYRICKDDVPGTWQRRHEMSLRGRSHERDEEDDKDKPRRRKEKQTKVKVNVELDDALVMMDLAEMTGEKRVADPVERRAAKKRK